MRYYDGIFAFRKKIVKRVCRVAKVAIDYKGAP